MWFSLAVRIAELIRDEFPLVTFLFAKERRTDNLEYRKGDEGNGGRRQQHHRQKATNATDEDHGPNRAKQDRLPLNRGDQPVERKAETNPDAGVEAKVAVPGLIKIQKFLNL